MEKLNRRGRNTWGQVRTRSPTHCGKQAGGLGARVGTEPKGEAGRGFGVMGGNAASPGLNWEDHMGLGDTTTKVPWLKLRSRGWRSGPADWSRDLHCGSDKETPRGCEQKGTNAAFPEGQSG